MVSDPSVEVKRELSEIEIFVSRDALSAKYAF